MSKPKFPVGHPFAGKLPVGVSPFEVADQLIAYRRQQFSGWTMKEDDEDEDPDEDPEDEDEDLDPETIIKVDGKEFALKDLQRIMRKEKSQGKRSGAAALLKDLGFDTLEDAKSAIAKVKKPAPKPDDDKDDDEAAQRAQQRETAAEARERKAAEKERKLDLRGALRDAGVSRDDLDDAHAILDREVDAEYDDDAIDDAVEELRVRRPGLFGDDDEDDDDVKEKKAKPPAKGRIPSGRPGKKKAGSKSPWQRGEELAKRRHGITTD